LVGFCHDKNRVKTGIFGPFCAYFAEILQISRFREIQKTSTILRVVGFVSLE
jgi:hypothetical protein